MNDNRTEQALAVEALQVQDACNLSGVAHGFSRAVRRLREVRPDLDSVTLPRHPVVQLWVDKLSDLTGRGGAFSDAYQACCTLAGLS